MKKIIRDAGNRVKSVVLERVMLCHVHNVLINNFIGAKVMGLRYIVLDGKRGRKVVVVDAKWHVYDVCVVLRRLVVIRRLKNAPNTVFKRYRGEV